MTLRVPYYMVPAAISNIQTRVDDSKINKTHTATAITTNYRGAVPRLDPVVRLGHQGQA